MTRAVARAAAPPRGPRYAGSLPGIAAAGAAMVAWGFSGILVALTTQAALVVALERLWLGVPMVGALLGVSRRRLTWRGLLRCVPGGVLLCGDIAMFFSAVKLTSIADATVIGALQPALVLLVARPLFAEHVERRVAAWTVVAIAGVVMVVVGARSTGHANGLGDLLAAGSLCCWTGYWLVSKSVCSERGHVAGSASRRRRAPPVALGGVEYTAGVMLVAPLAMVPITLLSGERIVLGTAADWLWIALMALVPGSAHLLVNWAHRFVDVSTSSVIVAVNPVIAAGAAVPVLHQPLELIEALGGVLALVAVVMAVRRPSRAPAALPAPAPGRCYGSGSCSRPG